MATCNGSFQMVGNGCTLCHFFLLIHHSSLTIRGLRRDQQEGVHVGYSDTPTSHMTFSRKIERFLAEDPSPATTVMRLSTRSLILICSITFAAFLVSTAVAIFFCRYTRRKFLSNVSSEGKAVTLEHLKGPRTFTYKELRKATRNFDETMILGSGGSGAVYKGILSPSGIVIAVKRPRHKSGSGEKAFVAEASSVSQIRHRNLLQLLGWCQEENNYLLVYEYMSNGSLDGWLFPGRRRHPNGPNYKRSGVLPWELRSSILAGVAAALDYLHEDWVQCVLHRDIKSSNVMLDADFNPHLGDFGLARLMDHEKLGETTLVAGTLGYMAPEIPFTGKATKESDVYSFGILVLEVVCGRRPLNLQAEGPDEEFVLLQSVWRAHEAGDILRAVDMRLLKRSESSTDTTTQESLDTQKVDTLKSADECKMAHLLHLGLLCCLPNPEARPSMRLVRQVIMDLQSTAPEDTTKLSTPYLLPALPLSRPSGCYSLIRLDRLSSTSTSVCSEAPLKSL
ncbi:L-type lectin-domain containing receptor kinase IX.1 isoform X2 [Physcomitrium patens]|uniref:L-type lectin-domain containing receptor kinase IX.1 isoform X2 n=1 Tax=Physcomitrium patens TaxID=3218 RepID=UPI003CCDF193